MEAITKLLKKQWNTDDVTSVVVDEEFGCVTATIEGATNIECGWIEDLKKQINE